MTYIEVAEALGEYTFYKTLTRYDKEDYVTEITKNEYLADLEEIFDRVDSDKDGKLDWRDFEFFEEMRAQGTLQRDIFTTKDLRTKDEKRRHFDGLCQIMHDETDYLMSKEEVISMRTNISRKTHELVRMNEDVLEREAIRNAWNRFKWWKGLSGTDREKLDESNERAQENHQATFEEFIQKFLSSDANQDGRLDCGELKVFFSKCS